MKYSEKYTVTSHDVDVNNNLRPSMVIRYMQETANHQMRDRKPSYYDFFFDGKSFILTRISVEIYEEIKQYDEIVAETWRCPAKGATFIRGYDILKDGHLAAKAYSAWAIVDTNDHHLYRISDVDISNYEEDAVPEMALKTRFRLPAELSFSEVGEKPVQYSDCDMNMHMNNTNYPNMLCNYIPDIKDKVVTSVNLRFMAEGAMDETLKIHMAAGDGPVPEDCRSQEAWYFYTMLGERTNVEAEIGTKKL